jgi:hypothetical protein
MQKNHTIILNSEEALIIQDLEFVIQHFYFATFNWEFFPVDWESHILFSIGNMT